MERLIAFRNQGQWLYGMLHRPDGTEIAPAVVLCHGFTGQRLESHRLFVKMARDLAAHGIAALRFDFRGSGESEGHFQDMTISGEISDAEAALRWLMKRHHALLPETAGVMASQGMMALQGRQRGIDPARLGLLGLSLGGCVSACVAGRHPQVVKALALWSAAAHPERFWNADAEKSLAGREFVDWGGNLIGRAFLEEARAGVIRPLAEIAHYSGPVLIVHGEKDASVPLESAQEYAAAVPGRKAVHIIAGADHVYSSFPWESEVIRLTREWFQETL
jgi:pimeloyl-ACP methyl ester carboxylesterase